MSHPGYSIIINKIQINVNANLTKIKNINTPIELFGNFFIFPNLIAPYKKTSTPLNGLP